jgi:hypothetical protein
MEIARAVIAVLLAWPAYRLASLWGRFFFNLYGLNSRAEVSYGYLRPLYRLLGFYLPLASLLTVIWWLWPWGHWGLLSLLTTWWGFKSGMRSEMLRQFVLQLLLNLKEGRSYEESWSAAEVASKALNVRRHFLAPAALIKYVASTTRIKAEGPEMLRRWELWVTSETHQCDEYDDDDDDDNLTDLSAPEWLIATWKKARLAGVPPEKWPFDADATFRNNLEWMAEFDPAIREQTWWKQLVRKVQEAT